MFEPQQGPVECRTLAPASGNTPHVVTKHGQTPAAAPVGDLCGALYLWHVFLGKRLQTDLVGRLWYTPRRGLQGQGPPLLVGRNMGAGNHGPPQRSAVSSGREPWWSLPHLGTVPGPRTEQEGLRAARRVPRAHTARTGTSNLLPTLHPVPSTAGQFLRQDLGVSGWKGDPSP